jgi:hypothetical protein
LEITNSTKKTNLKAAIRITVRTPKKEKIEKGI